MLRIKDLGPKQEINEEVQEVTEFDLIQMQTEMESLDSVLAATTSLELLFSLVQNHEINPVINDMVGEVDQLHLFDKPFMSCTVNEALEGIGSAIADGIKKAWNAFMSLLQKLWSMITSVFQKFTAMWQKAQKEKNKIPPSVADQIWGELKGVTVSQWSKQEVLDGNASTKQTIQVLTALFNETLRGLDLYKRITPTTTQQEFLAWNNELTSSTQGEVPAKIKLAGYLEGTLDVTEWISGDPIGTIKSSQHTKPLSFEAAGYTSQHDVDDTFNEMFEVCSDAKTLAADFTLKLREYRKLVDEVRKTLDKMDPAFNQFVFGSGLNLCLKQTKSLMSAASSLSMATIACGGVSLDVNKATAAAADRIVKEQQRKIDEMNAKK